MMNKAAAAAIVLLVFFTAGSALSLIFQLDLPTLVRVLSQKEIRFAIGLSLCTSLCSLALSVIIGIPAAHLLAFGKPPLKPLINLLLDLPVVMPPLVTGIGLLLLLGGQGLLGKFGPNAAAALFSPLGVVIAQTYVASAIFVRSAVSAFLSADINYIHTAHNLGLSPAKTLLFVEIPLIWKPLTGGCILAFSRAIGEFGACLMLAGATRMKTETLPIAIYLNISSGDFSAAIVCALILMFIAVFMVSALHFAQKGAAVA